MNLESIARAIIEHSIIPYAKASNIDINQLVTQIVTINYNNSKLEIQKNHKDNEDNKNIKRPRGRPKGSKNKIKISIAND